MRATRFLIGDGAAGDEPWAKAPTFLAGNVAPARPPKADKETTDRRKAVGALLSGLESRASPTTPRRREEEASARAAEIAALRAQANAVARRLDRNRRDLERETQAIVERDHLGFRSRSSSWTSSVTRERAGRRGYKV